MKKTVLLVLFGFVATIGFSQKKYMDKIEFLNNVYFDDSIKIDSGSFDFSSGNIMAVDSTGVSTTGYYTVTPASTATGSGSAGKIAVWSSSSALTNSTINLADIGGKSNFVATANTGMNFFVNDLNSRLLLDTGVTIFNSTAAASKDIQFLSSTDTVAVIDVANDRVGILNTSPSYELDVNGAIRSGKDGQDGQFRIYSEQGGTDYEVIFNPAAAMTMNTTYTLPVDDGTSSQVLATNGSGALSWATDLNGIYGGSGTISGNTTVSQVAKTLSFTGTEIGMFNVDGTTFSVDGFNNRVGIGTAVPVTPLHIIGDAGVFLTVSNALVGTPDSGVGTISDMPSDAAAGNPIYIEVSFNGTSGYILFYPKL